MKTLANYPHSGYIQGMKYILIMATLMVFVGCKQDRFVNTTARTWDDTPVELDSVPNDVVPNLLGNVGFHSRVFGVVMEPTEVYYKRSNDAEWVLVTPNRTDGKYTYTYSEVSHEVRFQYTNETWGYAIYW